MACETVTVTYIAIDGARHAVQVAVGQSLMQGIAGNELGGVIAECGGAGACGTCQVVIAGEWAARIDRPGALEQSMLDGFACVIPDRRLSCQIPMRPEYDGIEVQFLPDQQF